MIVGNMLKIASVAIVSILITSILTPSALYAADTRQKANLESCIRQLESSISRVEEFIKNRGISLPKDIEGNLTKAKTLLENAKILIGNGRYDEAKECLKEAMGCIRIVASYVCREVREEIREMVQEEAAIGLEVAIQTHRKFIEKLNNTVNSLEKEGIEVSDEIKNAIKNSSEILDNALSKLKDGKINETARLLGESKRIIAGIIGQLNKLVKGKIEEGRVAKEISKHLSRMEEITRNVENEVAKKGREEAINHLREVINKLNESLNKLNQLKKHLEEKGRRIRGIDEATSKIREKIDHVEKIGRGISK
jgi:tetratricopeptide (TPR) repeat protein